MTEQTAFPFSEQTKHTINDWLLLHSLQPEQLTKLLLSTNNYPIVQIQQFTDDLELLSNPVSYSADSVWQLAGAAFTHYFLSQANRITEVANSTKTNFESSTATPLTDRNAVTQEIKIELNYQHTCFDVLHVVHEFGHALHLSLTGSNFQPPILRELAALAAEKIFIKYLYSISHELAEATHWAWCGNLVSYLQDDLQDLRTALDEVGTPYRYRWNYPVAFLLADAYIENQPAECYWQLFEGTASLEEYLQQAASTHLLRIENYLPIIHSQPDEPNAIHAYRSLGFASLLDIENWRGTAELPIDEYYQITCAHMQDGTLLALVNPYQQPIGYATWQKLSNETIEIDHIAAPFGDHFAVLKQLKKAMPSSYYASSFNADSAIKEQIVW